MSSRNEDFAAVNFEDGTNKGPQNDHKVQQLQEHVQEVSNIMQQNIDKIIERGSNLDYLENRSEYLSNHSNEFRVGANRIQRKMWWQNMKINIIIGTVIAVIIVIIIVSLTSGK